MLIKSKRGTVVILLTMIFTALIILVFALIRVSIDRGIYSSVDSLGRVWGTSVLGEYDRYLYEDYGILAFYGDQHLVNERIDYYAKKTFSSKSYMSYGGCQSDLMSFQLSNVDNFQNAIKYSVDTGKRVASSGEHEKRSNNNNRLIGSLPSHYLEKTNPIKEGKAETLLFVLNHFNSENHVINSHSFFINELEYLIAGKMSDEKNKKAIKRKYVASRILPNSQYIYTHPKMMEAAMAAANLITPGPEAAATQIVLIETWAMIESENDWKIIEDKGKVPLVKTEESWALDESVLTQTEDVGYVKMNNRTGLDYQDYLKVLLLAEDEATLLYRSMDLIQINMRFNHYKDFLMSDYNVGLAFRLKVNNEEHGFTQMYQER